MLQPFEDTLKGTSLTMDGLLDYYKAEVFLTAGMDSEHAVYDIDSDTLTVTSADNTGESFSDVYPVVLRRAA